MKQLLCIYCYYLLLFTVRRSIWKAYQKNVFLLLFFFLVMGINLETGIENLTLTYCQLQYDGIIPIENEVWQRLFPFLS